MKSDGFPRRAEYEGCGPVESVALEGWAGNWALRARAVPRGQIAAGLLVDLVADPRQHFARTAAFPVTAAAAALRIPPVLLLEVLQSLADAGLLTWVCDDAEAPEGPVAVVTLTESAPAESRRPRP